jgi:hypothetical protein
VGGQARAPALARGGTPWVSNAVEAEATVREWEERARQPAQQRNPIFLK